MFVHFLFITSQLLLFSFTVAQDCDEIYSNDVKVFITVSSLASVTTFRSIITERQLELNWYNVLPQDGDWVGLFPNDPKVDKNYPLVKIYPSNHPQNYFRTSIQLPRFDFQLSNLINQCLGYWIAYIRNDVIIAQNCAKIQPQWMWESRNILGNFSLAEIMIPGTHNSGSYDLYKGKKSENIIVRYKMNQDEDLLHQFIYGIRSFDLRIASYPKNNKGEFWINHDKIKVRPFQEALDNIKHFVNATKEIIILDFHRFPVGFDNSSTHQRFISYLKNELGQWMVPRNFTRDVTLSKLWAENKRVVVMYSNSIAYYDNLLWTGLSQKWANTMEVDKLKEFLDQFAIGSSRFYTWAAMAQLTPTVWTVLSKPTKGLRYLADKVNRNITQWFRDEWWETGNVVATDYFHGNDIVEVAIRANEKRKKCMDKVMQAMFGSNE